MSLSKIKGSLFIDNGFLSDLVKKVIGVQASEVNGMTYEEKVSDSKHFRLVFSKRISKYAVPHLTRVSAVEFACLVENYKRSKGPLEHKVVNCFGVKVVYVHDSQIFRPEVLEGVLFSAIDKFKKGVETTKDFLGSALQTFKIAIDYAKTAMSADMLYVFLDIFNLILKIRDSMYFSFTMFFSVCLSCFTLYKRVQGIYRREFEPQTNTSIGDLLTGFAVMGLPTAILDKIKAFSAFTGKRLFDYDVMSDFVANMVVTVIDVFEWVLSPHDIFGREVCFVSVEMKDKFLSLIRSIFAGFLVRKDIASVCAMYTRYVTNPQILFDPSVRKEVEDLHKKCKSNVEFMSYVLNDSNRVFKTTWDLFVNNVVKSTTSFNSSYREEPLCIVFEGPAGSGKSSIMNKFVDMLRAHGLTTYCHSVPSTMDGKDFYDDYENQDVFIMDDVGQQGKSQWRYIINYVAPVKYPLPCASANLKNTKFFNSSIIVCTTNHFMSLGGFTPSDCISEPEALFRRPHIFKVTKDMNVNDSFAQCIEYFKFDHLGSKRFENKFINECAIDCDGIEVKWTSDNVAVNCGNLYKIFKHIERSRKRAVAHVKQDAKTLIDIVKALDLEFDALAAAEANGDVFFDAQTGRAEAQPLGHRPCDVMDSVCRDVNNTSKSCRLNLRTWWDVLVDGVEYAVQGVYNIKDVIGEWIKYYFCKIGDFVKDALSRMIGRSFSIESVLFCGFFVLQGFLLYNLYSCFVGEEDVSDSADDVYDRIKSGELKGFFEGESGSDKLKERILAIKNLCKTVVVKKDSHNRNDDDMTQAVVSNDKIMLPAHVIADGRYIDVYHTFEHYKNGHKELENVKLSLVKKYLSCDMALYKMDTLPLYRKNRNIFISRPSSRNLYYVNSMEALELTFGQDCARNDDVINYSTVVGNFQHTSNSGWFTPYTAKGLCGSVIATDNDGIIGFHVAGNGSVGFCVEPSEDIRKEIREFMMSGPNEGYDLRDEIVPGCSGARVKYHDMSDIDQVKALGETSLEKSVFHEEFNSNTLRLKSILERTDDRVSPVYYDGDTLPQRPPNFKAHGTPAKTLKAMGMKVMKHQGYITTEELSFIKTYLRTLFVKFDDLDDQEVAFGGEFVQKIDAHSSNGAFCEKDKSFYLDYEKREIKPELYQLVNRIKENVKIGKYDHKDFMCREAFKDERRKENKVDSPRTFRVMPLGHMWWLKKIFGKLMPHFSRNRHETGICIGFNPYTDFDILAKKLKVCDIVGDADFGKWDGSVMNVLMHAIIDTAKEFYVGEYEYFFDWFKYTICNSFTLLNDELWATTHGIPSGTWITLLLNCLVNKSLTALTIFRNKSDANVRDVYNVVDYVTGDDKVLGASGEMAKYFNLLALKEVAESLGMDCTNGDKSPIVSGTQSFEKLTFVKRHARFHPELQRFVGCLSLATLYNSMQWIDTSKDESGLVGKLRSIQLEAYVHSKACFREFTYLFESTMPYASLFSEREVYDILKNKDEEALVEIAVKAGKPSCIFVGY